MLAFIHIEQCCNVVKQKLNRTWLTRENKPHWLFRKWTVWTWTHFTWIHFTISLRTFFFFLRQSGSCIAINGETEIAQISLKISSFELGRWTKHSYKFGTTWVNDRIFIFMWTNPVIVRNWFHCSQDRMFCHSKCNWYWWCHHNIYILNWSAFLTKFEVDFYI